MNERIQQLADQLGPIATIGNWGRVEWTDNVYPQLGDQLYAAIDLQKFAELIVKECVEVVKWTPSQFPNDEYVKNIKEHFGIKE